MDKKTTFFYFFCFFYQIEKLTDGFTEYLRQEFEGKIIGPNDLIIASTVMAHDGRLITNNEREFKRIKSLTVENWLGE